MNHTTAKDGFTGIGDLSNFGGGSDEREQGW
jgi:hypothetical protein